MELFVIRGGRKLQGTVRASGSKNAALPIMAAALAVDGPTTLQNVPDLVDVRTLSNLLRTLGADVSYDAGQLTIKPQDVSNSVADYELVRKMRASFCVLGPMLARRGFACVSMPGGCNIGARPVDLHLKGLRALGAEIRVERGYVIAKADRLQGARIYLGGALGPTVTGTCNVMTAATLAEGTTYIEAAACEPEVVDLGNYLNATGARIRGLGTPLIEIEGVDSLSGTNYQVIPDRIEAATLLIAGAITGGHVRVENLDPNQMTAVLEKLTESGVQLKVEANAVTVSAANTLTPVECTALPHPGIPTDVQAQFMALLSTAGGISVVTDRVFPDRFMHSAELIRMGAEIRREGATAVISGVPQLSGAAVMASDLRASAALVLAALSATGESVIRRIYHLDRGYERLDNKLNALGADIQRRQDTPGELPQSLQAESLQTDSAQSVGGPAYLRKQNERVADGDGQPAA
jgi:UDP-N-acetylglucosamine 1-carboxyvinyltransferase